MGDGLFGHAETVTRAQTVTFLARMAGIKDDAAGYGNSFIDMPDSSYFDNAVSWAVVKGITKGTSDTTFGPYEDCTRGQIVTFIYRYIVQ